MPSYKKEKKATAGTSSRNEDMPCLIKDIFIDNLFKVKIKELKRVAEGLLKSLNARLLSLITGRIKQKPKQLLII